jgi:hypothetical protein
LWHLYWYKIPKVAKEKILWVRKSSNFKNNPQIAYFYKMNAIILKSHISTLQNERYKTMSQIWVLDKSRCPPGLKVPYGSEASGRIPIQFKNKFKGVFELCQ